MIYEPIHIDFYENQGNKPEICHAVMLLHPGTKLIDSRIEGPLYLNRYSQIGPQATVGKYSGMNEHCFFARGTMGAYCAIGARSAINPFNHPFTWLSNHEFQYHPKAFDWVEEWNQFGRLERTSDMFEFTNIGNDVWTGHHAMVLAGVSVGDGAVIAAGSVVTKDVPPYAIVAGAPAKIIRMRFSDPIIERLLKVKWWDFEMSQLSGLNFRDIGECLPRLEAIRAQTPSNSQQANVK
jgi:acetyltransferase-like isoleucine patch superfamily enzyme